jgi:LysM repeat protein
MPSENWAPICRIWLKIKGISMIKRSHRKAVSLLLVSEERSLSSAEASFLDEHLKTCPECKAYARLHVRLKRDLQPQAQDFLPTGPSRSITGSAIVSSIERKVKMRKMTNTARRLARAGLAIVLLGAFLWILFDLLPALTPGSFLRSGTPAATGNPSLFSNTQPVIPSQFVLTTTPEPEPSRTPPAYLSPTKVITYTVQEGDTVFGIAEKFNLKPETILWGNQEAFAENPHLLRPGMELNILPVDGVYHKWTAGESLTGVAEKYGVTPQDILNWPGNHLNQETLGEDSDPNIEPGTYLVIPGGKRQSTYFAPPTAGSNPDVDPWDYLPDP